MREICTCGHREHNGCCKPENHCPYNCEPKLCPNDKNHEEDYNGANAFGSTTGIVKGLLHQEWFFGCHGGNCNYCGQLYGHGFVHTNEIKECPICYDNIADTIASPCGHKCCESCWTKLFKSGLHNCPKCRSNIDKIDSDNKSDDKSDDKITEYEMKNSSKIQKLIEIIIEKIKKQEKVVIVSQWIETLNIVREIINKHFRKLKSITLQGSVSMKRRKDNIYIFQNYHIFL